MLKLALLFGVSFALAHAHTLYVPGKGNGYPTPFFKQDRVEFFRKGDEGTFRRWAGVKLGLYTALVVACLLLIPEAHRVQGWAFCAGLQAGAVSGTLAFLRLVSRHYAGAISKSSVASPKNDEPQRR